MEPDNEWTQLRVRITTRNRMKELAAEDRRTMTAYLDKLIEHKYEELLMRQLQAAK